MVGGARNRDAADQHGRRLNNSGPAFVPTRFHTPARPCNAEDAMEHPTLINPADHAAYRADKMGKSTIFESPRLLVGLNAFEPGQAHALHAHAETDKVYHVIDGEGV